MSIIKLGVKKKIPIEVFQLTKDIIKSGIFPFAGLRTKSEESCVLIDTREGTLVAVPGDWIAKGVQGEVYPIAEDIFAQTYDVYEGMDEFVKSLKDELTGRTLTSDDPVTP